MYTCIRRLSWTVKQQSIAQSYKKDCSFPRQFSVKISQEKLIRAKERDLELRKQHIAVRQEYPKER